MESFKKYSLKDVVASFSGLVDLGLLDANRLLAEAGIDEIDQHDFIRAYRESQVCIKNLVDGAITTGEFQEDMRLPG